MMNPSACLVFPFKNDNENDCMKRAFTVEEAVVSAIKCFLITRKGSRLGNNIGSFLPELLLTAIPTSRLPNLADELKQELKDQFNGVNILSVTLTRDNIDNVSVLNVSITISIPTKPGTIDINLDLPSIFSN